MPKSRKPTPAETPSDLHRIGWLADLCGLPPADAQVSLASSLLAGTGPAGPAAVYVAWWIHHAEPRSRFESALRSLPEMPDRALVATLLKIGYDGLLYQREGEIVGHVFFQRHGADLCAFSSSVSERHRGGKHWAIFVVDFVAFAYQIAGVTRARVGGGNHPITRGVVALLKPHVTKLGWRVSRDGWIDFSGRNEEGSHSD